MPIIACPTCQAQLQVQPDTKINCPKCGQKIRIPPAAPLPASGNPTVLVTEPQLPAAGNPTVLASAPAPVVETPEPFALPPAPPEPMEPHRGTAILALGILSFFVMPLPLGLVAWLWGNADLRKMSAKRMDPEGKGSTEAGKLCGMISSLLNLISSGLACCAGLCYFGLLFTYFGVLFGFRQKQVEEFNKQGNQFATQAENRPRNSFPDSRRTSPPSPDRPPPQTVRDQSSNRANPPQETKREQSSKREESPPKKEVYDITTSFSSQETRAGLFRYFFSIHNRDPEAFGGSVTITLFRKNKGVAGADTFTLDEPLPSKGKTSVRVDSVVGLAASGNDNPVIRFSWVAKVGRQTVASGEGELPEK